MHDHDDWFDSTSRSFNFNHSTSAHVKMMHIDAIYWFLEHFDCSKLTVCRQDWQCLGSRHVGYRTAIFFWAGRFPNGNLLGSRQVGSPENCRSACRLPRHCLQDLWAIINVHCFTTLATILDLPFYRHPQRAHAQWPLQRELGECRPLAPIEMGVVRWFTRATMSKG